jgi:kynurenine formamidase
VYTGWQEKWATPKQFLNSDAKDVLHFPGISGDTAKWLLTKRMIAGVGIDTHGADPGIDSNYQTNNAVLQANGIVLECLTNLDTLPPTGSTLVIAPLRLKDGSGTPLSVMAFSL